MKVIVVDDSATQRLILKSIIANYNSDLEIIELVDGTQALKTISDDEVSLVFSDINMEPMSGIELFEKAKELDKTPTFAFITSHLTDNVKEKVLSMGASHFLTKPISQESVIEILDEVMA
jgi:YesN/AraC family two-component response regulator